MENEGSLNQMRRCLKDEETCTEDLRLAELMIEKHLEDPTNLQ